MPLLGYDSNLDLKRTLDVALADLEALITGGVDAVMVENNYDTPHQIMVGPETVACMTYLTQKIVERTDLPVGVSVLWNDYCAALSIAMVTGARFIRLPVFIDHVRTNYGEVVGEPIKVMEYQRKINANNVAILTDIHVKHSQILNKDTIESSALQAIEQGSDGLIVTGRWTGDMPDIKDLKRVREAIGNFSIIVGSGADESNAPLLSQLADGVIVSTSIKRGKVDSSQINMKDYNQRVDANKVASFVESFKPH